MRRLELCLLGVICGTSMLTAGQVYGTLRDASGKGLPGMKITVVSPAKTNYPGTTGADGSYQVFVKETGKCEFRLEVAGKPAATANVFSYADPAKYELEFAAGVLKVK